MDRKIFSAILDFTEQLSEIYVGEDKTCPLNLYLHLLSKMTFDNKTAMRKVVEGFKKFILAKEEYLLGNILEIPIEESIYYEKSDKAYIPIGQILAKKDGNAKLIHKHLLTIGFIIFNKQTFSNKITEISASEGKGSSLQFLIDDATECVKVLDLGECKDMGEMLKKVVDGGVINKLMGKVGQKFESGELNMNELLPFVMEMMMGGMNSLPSKFDSLDEIESLGDLKIEEIKDTAHLKQLLDSK